MRWAVRAVVLAAAVGVNLAADGCPFKVWERPSKTLAIGFRGAKTLEDHDRMYDAWYQDRFGQLPREFSAPAVAADVVLAGIVAWAAGWAMGAVRRTSSQPLPQTSGG